MAAPVKVAAVTVALAVPAFLWPPKPARAAEVPTALVAETAMTARQASDILILP